MQVDYMVLADAAATANGKHYIHGAGWDRIFAASFPVVHPALSVAIRLRVPWHDTNRRHEVELDVVDEDGRSIIPVPPGPLQGNATTGRPAHLGEGEDQVVLLVLEIGQLRFEQAGIYAVLFRIDGLEAARSAFHVSHLQPSAAVRRPTPGLPDA